MEERTHQEMVDYIIDKVNNMQMDEADKMCLVAMLGVLHRQSTQIQNPCSDCQEWDCDGCKYSSR